MAQASRFNGTLVTLLSVGSNDTTNQCPGNNVQPSTWEIYKGLGPAYAVGLWISVGLICLVLLLEYIYLYLVFVRQVPRSRRESTMWINSMFFVPTFFSYLNILLPKSAPFIWLFYRKVQPQCGAFLDLPTPFFSKVFLTVSVLKPLGGAGFGHLK